MRRSVSLGLWLVLGVFGCSSAEVAAPAGDDAGSETSSDDTAISLDGPMGGDTDPLGDAPDAPADVCTTNEECLARLPITTPADCAEAYCEVATKSCKFRAKDRDGDGVRAKTCTAVDVRIETGDDCDDNDVDVAPGKWDGPKDDATGNPDSCDGKDNDCSGKADDSKGAEGKICNCKPGATRECSADSAGVPISFPTGTPLGACKKGVETCSPTAEWSGCVGAVAPKSPDCSKKDDLDCDGLGDDTQTTTCTTADGCTGSRCGTGACLGASTTTAWAIDKDNDGYCQGEVAFCMGKSPGPGYRVPSTCKGLADCDDANPAAWTAIQVRRDADGDQYCTGVAITECGTGIPSVGSRLATTCLLANDDCDSVAGSYINVKSKVDADGDTYCTGVEETTCTAGAAPPGRRLSGTCTGVNDECDSSPGLYVKADVRKDLDGDTYCTGPSTSICTTMSSGKAVAGAKNRLTSECNKTNDDCDDILPELTTNHVIAYDSDTDAYCRGDVKTVCTDSKGTVPAGNAGFRLKSECVSMSDCRDTNKECKTCYGDIPGTCSTYSSGLAPSTTVSWQVDGGAIGVTSSGTCNASCVGVNNVCNCRTFTGTCPVGQKLESCWTTGVTGGCSNWLNGVSGGASFSGELRLGTAAWTTCTGKLVCRCTAI